MNVRIRNKEDVFFIIGAILITPLICFYKDVRAGKKEKKGFWYYFNSWFHHINVFCYFSNPSVHI